MLMSREDQGSHARGRDESPSTECPGPGSSAIVSIKRYHCEDITVPSWTPNSPDAMGGQAALCKIHKEGACVSCISRVKEASWD